MNYISEIPKLTANAVNLLLRVARFAAIVFAFFLLYRLLLEQFFDGSKEIIPLLLLWIISSYIVIPKVHHFLANYYLPNYFVGRIRSPSGLLSDPVNIAIIGDGRKLHEAMIKAGWTKAEKLTPLTFVKTAWASVTGKSYPSAPVGNMYLFNRRHDFAYQIEVGGSPDSRHHIRFWKTPKKWFLPGGHEADWLAAATFDTHVGIKIATGQLDHFIHEDIDVERDFVVDSLKKTGRVKNVEIVEHFTTAFHDRNNGGDRIRTDGSLPFIHLKK